MQPWEKLPKSWLRSEVGSVGEVRLGRQRSPDKHTGRYTTPYIRAANITPNGIDLIDLQTMDFSPEQRATFGLSVGDVLLTEGSGSPMQVGRPAIWRGELAVCCFQNTVLRFRSRAVLPEFAYLVFRSYMLSGVFARTARGSGIQHLSATRFARLPFPVPPIPEQRRIVASAGEQLKELRQAQQFLRTNLETLGDQTNEILADAASGRLSTANGDDWPQVRIADAGEVRLGKARGALLKSDSAIYPYLRVANVYEDRLDLSDVHEMSFTPSEFERYRLLPGDILLNEGQSPELVGRPAVYRGELENVCFQNSLIRFRPHANLLVDFAMLVFRDHLCSGAFQRASRSSTNIAHLSAARFADLKMPLPSLADQAATASEAQARLEHATAQRKMLTESLERLGTREEEILQSAASGSLVSQDPHEGRGELAASESVGSRRLGYPSLSATENDQESEESVDISIRTAVTTSLSDVIRQAGRPISGRELLSRASIASDNPAEVEQFYVQLRSELNQTIFPVAGDTEDQLLGTAEHAAH